MNLSYNFGAYDGALYDSPYVSIGSPYDTGVYDSGDIYDFSTQKYPTWKHSTAELHLNYGSDESFELQVADSFGNAIDLTGWELRGHISEYIASTHRIPLTISTVAPETGRFFIDVTNETLDYTRPRYWYVAHAIRGSQVKLIGCGAMVTR